MELDFFFSGSQFERLAEVEVFLVGDDVLDEYGRD